MLEDNDHEFRVQDSIAVVWPSSQFGEAINAGREKAAEQQKCPDGATKAAMTAHGIKEMLRRCAAQRERVCIARRLHVNDVQSQLAAQKTLASYTTSLRAVHLPQRCPL